MSKKKWVLLTVIFLSLALIITVGCTTETEYLNARDSVEEYLYDKYPELEFELIDCGKIPKSDQTYRFSFSDSNSHDFSVLADGKNISDNYIDNLLKEEVTEIINGIVNESKYIIDKAYVSCVSYKSFEGISVYDCSEVGLDLMVSGEKISEEGIDKFAQFLNENLKRDIDIKRVFVVYSYSDSKTDGYINHSVTVE